MSAAHLDIVNNEKIVEFAVIGSGPGGCVTALELARAGKEVLMIEDGPWLQLDSATHFSSKEALQKYRNGGITVGLGKAQVSYVEGNCVGGGSEVNRGLYHRAPERVLEGWRRDFQVADLSVDSLRPHHEACEALARVSYLPGEAPGLSMRLVEGAEKLGWNAVEVPRLFQYSGPGKGKQSMSASMVPAFLDAGGRLVANTRVQRLSRTGKGWLLHARRIEESGELTHTKIRARTVFVACGSVYTPLLLRRSGIKRNIGNSLRVHPMVKAVGLFDDDVNLPGQLDPVHQVDEFYPTFSLGCSISTRPILALTMVEHLKDLPTIDALWRKMGIYYVQTSGGRGTVRGLPFFGDPVVRMQYDANEISDLRQGVVHLVKCLLTAGARKVYPAFIGAPVISHMDELAALEAAFLPELSNLSTLHMFSSCPMGENTSRCAANSYGRVFGQDKLYIADSSLLCGPTQVNPQGTVMAVAHRNVTHFLENR